MGGRGEAGEARRESVGGRRGRCRAAHLWPLLRVCLCRGRCLQLCVISILQTIDFGLFVVCLFLSKLPCAQIMSCMCVYGGLEPKCKYSLVHLILFSFFFLAAFHPSPRTERGVVKGNLLLLMLLLLLLLLLPLLLLVLLLLLLLLLLVLLLPPNTSSPSAALHFVSSASSDQSQSLFQSPGLRGLFFFFYFRKKIRPPHDTPDLLTFHNTSCQPRWKICTVFGSPWRRRAENRRVTWARKKRKESRTLSCLHAEVQGGWGVRGG